MAGRSLAGMGEAGIRCDVAGSGSICDILLAGSGVPACASGRFHMITYHDSHVFYFMSELCMHNHIDLINALSILLLLLLRSNRGLNSTGLTVYTTIFCVLQSTHITKYTVRAYHTEANSSPDPDPIFPSHANLESAKERQDTAIPYSMLHIQNPFSAK